VVQWRMGTVKPLLEKIKAGVKSLAQRLVITARFFDDNGLANHAAAGAFGFLLSVAPMLLIVSFFLMRAFRTAPEAAEALFRNTPFQDIAAEQLPALDVLVSAPPGIPALVSMLSVLWAGRIFAVSLHRGLKIVFAGTKKRNPVQDNLVTLAIEFFTLILMLATILASGIALRLYDAAGFFGDNAFARFLAALLGNRALRFAALGFVLYAAYRLVPANPPGRLSALWGAVFCAAAYGAAAALLETLLRQPRYNFIYGTLGDLVILLMGVYFFFLCFFAGAQFAAVTNSIEALLFLRLRETRLAATRAAKNGQSVKPSPERGLFSGIDGKLKKYYRFYAKGETVMSRGETGTEVFFLLEGEAEVLLPSRNGVDSPAATLKPGSFLGEMSYLLDEARTATIVAKTDVSALALPPPLFEAILGRDTGLDRSIIENLTRRIKRGNERIANRDGG